jgi:hypothetical protein
MNGFYNAIHFDPGGSNLMIQFYKFNKIVNWLPACVFELPLRHYFITVEKQQINPHESTTFR